jgi:hypothetical protein
MKQIDASGGVGSPLMPTRIHYSCAVAENKLGVKFRGVEEMLYTSMASLKAHGHYKE